MAIVSLIAIYFVVWWITLFSVLPWAVRKHGAISESDVSAGNMPGAPDKPNLKRVVVINSVVAAVVTGLLWAAIQFGGLSVKGIADFVAQTFGSPSYKP